MPSSFCVNSASSRDFTDVEPPAPHVTVTKRGANVRCMRSNRARRFEKPEVVFGGKNSRETYEESGGSCDIASVILTDMLTFVSVSY